MAGFFVSVVVTSEAPHPFSPLQVVIDSSAFLGNQASRMGSGGSNNAQDGFSASTSVGGGALELIINNNAASTVPAAWACFLVLC